MRRSDLGELHYITPIDNLPSILDHGILSHNRAAALPHTTVAMAPLQGKRAGVTIPGGRPLHEYVNLYVCARNPMMFKRKDTHLELCVLSVSSKVLDLPDVVVSDSNAASEYVRFAAAPDGLKIVDKDATFAEYWTDPDPIVKFRKAARKCAEVLVPDVVPAHYIRGAYVSCTEAQAACEALRRGLKFKIAAHLFFR